MLKSSLQVLEPYDFCVMDNEIFIFFYDGADDAYGNTLTFQNVEEYEKTKENLRVVLEYFVEMQNHSLKCKKCGKSTFDKEIVVKTWIKDIFTLPKDLYYECDSCLEVKEEERGIVGRNYNEGDEQND